MLGTKRIVVKARLKREAEDDKTGGFLVETRSRG
jgi:hypothetical protein